MVQLKVHWKSLMIVCSLVMLLLIIHHGEASAVIYYVSYDGSGTLCSSSSPCALNYGVNTKASSGDTVFVKDGTYNERLFITNSGTSDNMIRVIAEHDGQPLIKYPSIFPGSEAPLQVVGDWVEVKGLRFEDTNHGSGSFGAMIIGGKGNIIRRCSFFNTSLTAEMSGKVIVANSTASSYSESILLEDNLIYGLQGKINTQNSNYVVMRRNFLKGNQGIYLYDSHYSIAENNIFFSDPNISGTSESMGVNCSYSSKGSYNKMIGHIAFSLLNKNSHYTGMMAVTRNQCLLGSQVVGNEFINNVSINAEYSGIDYEAGLGGTIENVSIVWEDSDNTSYQRGANFERFQGSSQIINVLLKNSILRGNGNGTGLYIENSGSIAVSHSYNSITNFSTLFGGKASPEVSEGVIPAPSWDTGTYGYGAYLMHPKNLQGLGNSGDNIGAEVIYRYENGKLTSTPLWPWPMEARFCAETGYSITYKNGCLKGGGLWNTLDNAYASYPSTPPPTASTACSDGTDNDNDGFIDMNDPGCTSIADNDEDHTNISNSVTALKTLSPITVDGESSENVWSQSNYVTFSNPLKSDNHVKVSSLWNNDNLYLMYDVTDGNLGTETGHFWNEDSAEIYIDTNNDKTSSMDSNDYRFFANISNLTSNGNVISRTTTKLNGYIMEIAIPWNVMNIFPTGGKTMGLLLVNNDSDNSQSSQFDWLDLIETGSFARPSLWGNISLSNVTAGTVDTVAPAPPLMLSIK